MVDKRKFEEERDVLCMKMSALLPKLRYALGLSQANLGEYVNISRQTISEIERGEYHMSWNQFASLYLIFGANRDSHDILADNEMDIRSIAPVVVIPRREKGQAEDISQDFE